MSKTEIIEALKILNDIAKSNQMAGGLQDQVTKLVYEKMIELLKMF